MAKWHQNLEASGDEKLKIYFKWPYYIIILHDIRKYIGQTIMLS